MRANLTWLAEHLGSESGRDITGRDPTERS
jgi:hypothetical protein